MPSAEDPWCEQRYAWHTKNDHGAHVAVPGNAAQLKRWYAWHTTFETALR